MFVFLYDETWESFFLLCEQVQLDKVDMVGKKDDDTKSIVFLSSPLSLDGNYATSSNGGVPNLLQRVFSLFKNVRPGSDLTSFQVSILYKFRIYNIYAMFDLRKIQ